ncbi:alpha/beta hydrolase [Companilactobacillus sp. HBUAS59544]|uniref:alpha/beta hydrolase n=1 Tax=Companilactobacillus sp. HBUAS59544 TaxID=3109363 RepID=UPI002FEF7987
MLEKFDVENNDYQMKLVPKRKESGYLDPHAEAELKNGIPQTDNDDSKIDLTALRESMGYKNAKHEQVHELMIKNKIINGVKVREFVQKSCSNKVLPTLLFVHGGGFIGGSVDNVELPCEALADFGEVRVISVEYGLAPEHPFPQGLIDVYQVVSYIGHNKKENQTSTITVMGDSAGGNLTYAVSLLDRQMGTNIIDKAVALYPVTYQGKDPSRRKQFDDPDNFKIKENQALVKNFIKGFNGSQSMIDNFYIQKTNPESIYVSPLNADENLLKKMPKTLFMIGEFDPLRFQGEAFYQKMKLAGGDIQYIRYNGMIHAFMDKVGDFPQADDALLEAIKFVLNE